MTTQSCRNCAAKSLLRGEMRTVPYSFFLLPVSLSKHLAHLFLTTRVQQHVKIIIAIMMPPATCNDNEIGRRPEI